MKQILFGVSALVILAVLLAGCTAQQPATPSPAVTPEPTLAPVVTTASPAAVAARGLTGNWRLTLMGVQQGTAVIHPNAAITLAFDGMGNLTGNGGCNNYFGTYSIPGGATDKGTIIALGAIGSTKMYCADYSGQESDYLAMLQKTDTFVIDGTQLTLTGKTGDVLIYQRPSTVPTMGPTELPA